MYQNRNSARDTIAKLAESGAITHDGKDWMTAALDPFHDMEHTLAGYPDACVSQTVVSCYQYQTTVTAPAGVAGDWDAHVYTLPIAQATECILGAQSADWASVRDYGAIPTYQYFSLLNVYKGPAGVTLLPTYPVPANTASQVLPTNGVEELVSGTSRVIALGFEVHNTTADIYKQGAVLTYRMPTNPGYNQILYGPGTASPPATNGVLTGYRFPQPPMSQAEANRLKTARTWDAREGVYATCFQSSVENPLRQDANQTIFFTRDSDPGQASTLWFSTPVTPFNPMTFNSTNPLTNKTVPFDTTGAMFTGLSNQTSLTIKLRVYVERAPGFSLPDLAPLASPSAGYDVRALELYAQIINSLPAAVKVGENAAGDWWRAVNTVAKKYAEPLGRLLGNFVPGAGLVGSGISFLAGQLDPKRPVSRQVIERVQGSNPPRQMKPATTPRPRRNPQQAEARPPRRAGQRPVAAK